MTSHNFNRKMRTLQQHMEALWSCALANPEQLAERLPKALEDLQRTLEELQVTDEALRQQNETLMNACEVAEIELQRYRTLFDFAPDGYLVTDATGVIQEANRMIATLLNVPQNDLPGKPLADFMPKGFHGTLLHQRARLQQPDQVCAWEGMLQPRLSPPLPVAISMAAARTAQGTVAVLRWLFRNLTLGERTDGSVSPHTPSAGRFTQGLSHDFPEIVGQSEAMQDLFCLIKLVANSEATVLVQGESGTGKELVARAIHRLSPRQGQPFVAINCSALPESLLESELFGYVKGAFTGANKNKKGLFEEAHGGTLLLDEIGDTTLVFQAKLLRVLQDREIRPVGSTKSLKVDVRVIAATNRNLQQRVQERSFREELYYRLAVVPVLLPPLRQRQEDIPRLVDHFMKKYCVQNQRAYKRISTKTVDILRRHAWPGNVRELEYTIERAVLLSPGSDITPEVFNLPQPAESVTAPLASATQTAVETVERARISKAIHQTNGNLSQAAKLLQISRATLYNKLKRYSPLS